MVKSASRNRMTPSTPFRSPRGASAVEPTAKAAFFLDSSSHLPPVP